MAIIPLEDSFTDIVGKTQRGLKLTDDQLAKQAGISVEELARVKGGDANEPLLRQLAAALKLGAEALVASADKAWAPQPVEVPGLKQFNTVYEDMTVNFYLAWHAKSKQAVVFDTGADCSPALEFAMANGLSVKLILLTHTHVDHIIDLARLKAQTGAPAWVGKNENFAEARPFSAGKTFKVGALKIETRQTSGHAAGGITYVISRLERPVAVVGDALFAGSMGGGMISFAEALDTNRRNIFTLPDNTVLCPGHGPLTTVGEEKAHNPFYPEFQTSLTSQQKGKSMTERIGVVGVGRMGANMARRLKEVGYPVTAVFDVRKAAADEVGKEIGAESCSTLARVTEQADVIITVVTDDKAMLKVFAPAKAKADTLLRNASGKVFINCATISPKVHVEVEKLAKKAGAESLEACMASSINQARAGTLYLMAGGAESTFQKVQPILTKLSDEGKLLRYIGKAGQAAIVKALVNMVMNINTAGLAEGLAVGNAYGIDLKLLMEVFSQTGANSRVLVTDGEDMMNRDHSCFFSASHAAKDSGIALNLGLDKKMNLPLATATLKQYSRMVKEGLGELDKSGIAELTFKGRHKSKKK
jgi:3-hydroxyisobutyrate dehydrogenase-like beta-hydroxyacid dehydrogenase